VNRIRIVVIFFISISILSCSSTDKKIQNSPVEQKETPVIKRDEIAKEPKKTDSIQVEKPTVIIVEKPRVEAPKKETIKTTPPLQNIVQPKIKIKEVKEPIVKEPIVKEPIVKEPIVKEPIVKEPIVKEPIVKEPQLQQTKTLTGQINITDDADISSTVVYFTPDDGIYSVEPKSNFNISTKNKRFEPSVLVIPVGSEVNFPNLDRILHNVFSVSGVSQFDLGLYSAGTVKSVKFDKPGIIYVHCNVHHSMQADILVLDTPWYTNVNDDGSFSLEDLPNKPGTLHVWHPRSNLMKLSVNNNQINGFDIDLAITRKKVPKHLNKFGKSYRPKERY